MLENLSLKHIIVLLISLFILNAVDGVMTLYVLAHIPTAVETNPLFSQQSLYIKAFLPALFALFWGATWYLAWRERDEDARSILVLILIGLVIFYAIVVAWNTIGLIGAIYT